MECGSAREICSAFWRHCTQSRKSHDTHNARPDREHHNHLQLFSIHDGKLQQQNEANTSACSACSASNSPTPPGLNLPTPSRYAGQRDFLCPRIVLEPLSRLHSITHAPHLNIGETSVETGNSARTCFSLSFQKCEVNLHARPTAASSLHHAVSQFQIVGFHLSN